MVGPIPVPSTRPPRFESLDIWRGVACLSVACFHASFYAVALSAKGGVAQQGLSAVLSRMWAGVPLFFVISGYCITAAVDGSPRRARDLRRYFLRRFRRIYPPFWFVVAGGILLVIVGEAFVPRLFTDELHPINPPASLGLAQWLGNLTLTESWRYHIVAPSRLYFLGHAWTLAYEEQFYALMGGLLWLSREKLFRNALLLTVVTGIVAVAARRTGIDIDGFFFDGRWLFFAAGILVFWAVNYGTVRGRRVAAVLLVLPLIATSVKRGALLSHEQNIIQESWVAALFALVLLATHRVDAALISHPLLQPLRWCGERCYSIYLVHWPVVKLTSHAAWILGVRDFWMSIAIVLPLSLAATLATGAVFHAYVERRFLNSPTRRAARPIDLPAPPMAAPSVR